MEARLSGSRAGRYTLACTEAGWLDLMAPGGEIELGRGWLWIVASFCSTVEW